jgi:hypothetical protein
LGTLMFEKPESAKAVFELLYTQINKPITAVGAIEVLENFGDNASYSRRICRRSLSFPQPGKA